MSDLPRKALRGKLYIDVEFYNREHAALLEKYPSAAKIQAVAGKTLQVPVAEFLKNMMFHRVRHQHIRVLDADSERRDIVRGYHALDPYVRVDGDSIRLSEGVASVPNHVSEYIGESISLSVANRIFGLTDADWIPIAVDNRRPSFDYQSASNGSELIQLEMKGSAVDDTELKSSSISTQSGRIDAKKVALASTSGIERIGTIVSFPKATGRIKCWLLDPEPDIEAADPRRLKLLSRLNFIWWVIWIIAPRSRLAMALASRIAAIRTLRDPFELTRIPLREASGEPMEVRYPSRVGSQVPNFFLSRSRIVEGPAGGVVVPIDRESMLFIGFREDLLHQAVKQDFDKILNYEASEAVIPKQVSCVVRHEVLRRMGVDLQDVRGANVSNTEVRFERLVHLAYTPEGLVFGELEI